MAHQPYSYSHRCADLFPATLTLGCLVWEVQCVCCVSTNFSRVASERLCLAVLPLSFQALFQEENKVGEMAPCRCEKPVLSPAAPCPSLWSLLTTLFQGPLPPRLLSLIEQRESQA